METVGYLGPGTSSFGYAAAFRQFGSGSFTFSPFTSHQGVYNALARREISYAVVAIENAIAGVVDETARIIVEGATASQSVRIVAETAVPIELRIMAKRPGWQQIRRVASHDMALRQASRELNKLLSAYPHLELMRCESTAAAAQCAALDETVAAIASPKAMKALELCDLVGTPVDDKANNQTRFLVLAHDMQTQPSQADKTILLLNLNRNKVGSLQAALACFAEHGACLSLIYPCPRLDRDWEYTFLLELEQHADTLPMRSAFMDLRLRGLCEPIVLGSYRNLTTAALPERMRFNIDCDKNQSGYAETTPLELIS